MEKIKLTAENLNVTYINKRTNERVSALESINLDIKDGEFTCIVGPSGCGKTTFLNTISGLIKPTNGCIKIDQKRINGPGKDRATVFQYPNLLPWRTETKNVSSEDHRVGTGVM